MAETATAEVVRDQADDGPAPQTPPPTPTPFDTLSANIRSTYGDVLGARQEQEKGLAAKAAAVNPRLEAASKASDDFAKEIEQHRAELTASRPEIKPPPSRKLTEFLAPHEGESPEASIGKLISGLTLFATGLGGLAKGDATAGLAAMKGALEGWHAGDKERADRAFGDWHAKTQAALDQWENERTSYADWIEAKNLSLDQMLKGAELQALKWDNANAVNAFRTGTQESALDYLTKQQNHADQVATNMLRIQQMHEDRQAAIQAAAQRQRDHDEYMLTLKKMSEDKKAADQQAAIDAYTPEALTAMGQSWALTGKMPSIGAAGKGASVAIRGKVIQAGIDWAKENGIDPSDLPSVQAEVAASKSALTKLRGVDAVQQAAIKRFDGHADKLLELSAKVDRSGSPVVNRALLKARGEYAGDADVAAFETQALELAMEFSRVIVGTAQGDANTREEARKTISAAMNPDQLKAVVETLRGNAHRNIETNKASEKSLTDLVTNAGGYAKGKGKEASGSERIRVRRKVDGMPGTIERKDFDPNAYEEIK